MTGRILIRGGHVVTMDDKLGDIPKGDVLVENGKIADIRASIVAPDAEVIDAGDAVVLPGIIDAHNCLWQTALRGFVLDLWSGRYYTELLPLRRHLTEPDLHDAGLVGGLEMLSYGCTTVVDYCHAIRAPGFAEAALRGVQESGIRHVFTYSFMAPEGDEFNSLDARLAEGERFHDRFHDPDSLTTIAFGINSVGTGDIPRELATTRKFGASSCIHVNQLLDIERLAAGGLLGPDLMVIHGNLITNPELDLMAKVKMPICFTPSADVQGTPADVVRRAGARGVPVVFGCDIPSHVASDTIAQLRIMFNVQGYIDGAMERSFSIVAGRRALPQPGVPTLLPRTLLKTATIGAAEVLGLADRIGSLTPGKAADILVIRRGDFGDSLEAEPCAHVILQTSPRDIDTVMVGGVVRVREGRLVDHKSTDTRALMRRAGERIMTAAKIG